MYLLCVVKTSGKECYQGFDVTAAWNALLEATNEQESVEMIVRPMDHQEARRSEDARTARSTA